jgi:hypothetical protein
MIERVIRFVSWTACVLVILGFAFFAYDQLAHASKKQQNELAGIREPDPSPANEREREKKDSQARELVDDANDVLLKPFANVVTSRQPWVARGIPTLLALLVYGVALGYLASFARGRF